MERTQTIPRRFACKVDDLAYGESMTINGENRIALFRSEEGQFFATSDSCTHEEWSLGEEGEIEGDEIVCPLHMARFDMRTGQALCFPATISLKTYEVEVHENGDVHVLG